MKNLIAGFLIAFIALPAAAQSRLEGRVVDSESSEPVVGATVVIPNTVRGTATDADGRFSLVVPAFPVTIGVSSVGYRSTTLTVESAGIVEIALDPGMALDEMVVVGSRGAARTVLTSMVPIDNIQAQDLMETGQLTVEQMLNYRVPSYNSSHQAISDATAHFDPSELRNLGPSRTLVLVNGKRKNQSSLVYVNDTPGKGEVGVDMKSIPASAIERIEVLRDGASALYGSDAIAGVINVVLKNSEVGSVDIGTGVTTKGDGLTYSVDVNKGLRLKGGATLNVTGSWYHQDATNRAGEPGGDGLFGVIFGDPAILNGTHPWIQKNPDLGMNIGQADYDKGSLLLNYERPINDGAAEVYAFGGGTMRDGTSMALYRAPYWISSDFGKLTEPGKTYEGFQPTFETSVLDAFGTVGVRTDVSGWSTDVSVTAGTNTVDYEVGNSINVSLGASSPTRFDVGAYGFGHMLANVDLSRKFGNLTVTAGTEARRETFDVTAGQEESYVGGGVQSFPGLQPSNELSADRTNVGVYAAADLDASSTLALGGAVRFENYSDFGSNLSWKIAGRQLLGGERGAIRASINTGFRAPSLHQIYLSNIQTLVSGGTVSNQGTFNNVSDVVRGLGIDPLDAETSFNVSAGLTYRLADRVTVSADYYNISLDNRVLFTGEIGFDGNAANTNPVERILLDYDVTSIKFFVNAMDTKTQGFDVVLNYTGIEIGSGSSLDITWATNVNSTEIEGAIKAPAVLAAAGYDIFSRKEQARVVSARPDLKTSVAARLHTGRFVASLNNTYFGEVTWQHASDTSLDQTFAAKVLTDLVVGYKLNDDLNVHFSANNLFNVYPDPIEPGSDFVTDLGGRFRWPWEVNQFGFNGTTLRVGLNLKI